MVSYLVSTVFSTKNADSFFLILTSWSSWKTLDFFGGKGGAILRAHQKKDFGAIPYFLVIVDYEKAFLYVGVEIVSLRKCIQQTGPTD